MEATTRREAAAARTENTLLPHEAIRGATASEERQDAATNRSKPADKEGTREAREVAMSEQIPILEDSGWFGITWIHPCALHLGELEIDPIGENGENIPGCPECGCLLETDECIWCGATWIAFGSNAFDDTIRSATVDESGDLMCVRCATEEQDELDQDSGEWEDDFYP